MRYGYVANGFLNHNTITSRLASDSPNLQNIPRKSNTPTEFQYHYGPKKLFVSRFGDEGVILQADYCLSGDTLVETVGGKRTMKDIVESVQRGEDVYVYSCDPETFKTVVSRVEKGLLTFKDRETFKVTLDNGESVIATKEHPFMLRDGSYKTVEDLTVGDFLMTDVGTLPTAEETPLVKSRRIVERGIKRLQADNLEFSSGNWKALETGVSWEDASETAILGGLLTPVTVVSIEPYERMDVYDIKVEHFSNFALSAGIFVHNSQLELRVAAIFSNDANLQQAYRDGKDIHIYVASKVNRIPEEEVTDDLRTAAKAVN